MKKKVVKNKLLTKGFIFSCVAVIVLLAASSIIGLMLFRQHQANKIYSVGETVHFPTLALKTKTSLKKVSVYTDNDLIKQYGGLGTKENCDVFSQATTETMIGQELLPYGPSDYNLCTRRNDSRNDINKYVSANRTLVIDYTIFAAKPVSTSTVKLTLIPDSGRDVKAEVNSLKCSELILPSTTDYAGVRYSVAGCGPGYKPYVQSELGENISQGLSRSGNVSVDVRNSEKTIDFIMSYYQGKSHWTRTVRINLDLK